VVLHKGQLGIEAQQALSGLLDLQEELIDVPNKLINLSFDDVRDIRRPGDGHSGLFLTVRA
jgi:hypothetical protein